MFKLGDRIHSAINDFKGNPSYANGVVAVVLDDEQLEYLNDEIKNHSDMDYYRNAQLMEDGGDVIVLFDDGHLEWGYYGDGDFTNVN